jgi:hypothetical protein
MFPLDHFLHAHYSISLSCFCIPLLFPEISSTVRLNPFEFLFMGLFKLPIGDNLHFFF